jgi:hypothetical protein
MATQLVLILAYPVKHETRVSVGVSLGFAEEVPAVL